MSGDNVARNRYSSVVTDYDIYKEKSYLFLFLMCMPFHLFMGDVFRMIPRLDTSWYHLYGNEILILTTFVT